MKSIDKEVLKDAANRLLFTMSDSEYDTLEKEFAILTKQMKKIAEIKGVDDYEPMTFPFPCETSFLREDEVADTLSRDEALKNAGNKQDNQIKLPKVVL